MENVAHRCSEKFNRSTRFQTRGREDMIGIMYCPIILKLFISIGTQLLSSRYLAAPESGEYPSILAEKTQTFTTKQWGNALQILETEKKSNEQPNRNFRQENMRPSNKFGHMARMQLN